jgi:hypothetical protein
MVAFDSCGAEPRSERADECRKMKNPAGFVGEQGSRKSMIQLDRELPACLLVASFACARWLRIDDATTKA